MITFIDAIFRKSSIALDIIENAKLRIPTEHRHSYMGYDPKKGGFCERKTVQNIESQSKLVLNEWWILIIIFCRTVKYFYKISCNRKCCGLDSFGWIYWGRCGSSCRTTGSIHLPLYFPTPLRCSFDCRDWIIVIWWWSWRLTCFRSPQSSLAQSVPAIRRCPIPWSPCAHSIWFTLMGA